MARKSKQQTVNSKQPDRPRGNVSPFFDADRQSFTVL
jgi:hypothetical protein